MAVLVSGVGAAALIASAHGFDLGTPAVPAKDQVAACINQVKKLAAANPSIAAKLNLGINDFIGRNPQKNNVAGAKGLLDWALAEVDKAKKLPAAAPVVSPSSPTISVSPPPAAAAPTVANATPAVSLPYQAPAGTQISRPQLVLYPGDIVRRQSPGSIRGENYRAMILLDEPQKVSTAHYMLTWLDETGTHAKEIKPGDLIPYGFTVDQKTIDPAPTASTAAIVPTGGASGGSGSSLLGTVAALLGGGSAPQPAGPVAAPASAAFAGVGSAATATTDGGIAPSQPAVTPGTPASSGGAGSATDPVGSLLSNPYVIASGVGLVALFSVGILMLPSGGRGR